MHFSEKSGQNGTTDVTDATDATTSTKQLQMHGALATVVALVAVVADETVEAEGFGAAEEAGKARTASCTSPLHPQPHQCGSIHRHRLGGPWRTASHEPARRGARRPTKGKKKGLAATYSPAFPQYHRRESA